MFVVEYGDGSFQSPRVEPNRLLQTRRDVEGLLTEAYSVVIDTRRGLDAPAGLLDDPDTDHGIDDPPSGPDADHAPLPEVAFGEEIHRARRAYNRALEFANRLLGQVRTGKPLHPAEADPVAEDIVGTASRSRKCAASLAVVRSHGWITNHCVNVAFLAAAFGRHLGLPRADVRSLVLAGLFHDIGKVRLPASILNKPGKLTAEEYDVVKRHPVAGASILRDAGGVSVDVLTAVLEHHEYADGSGYPRGIRLADMGPHAKVLAICDVYDALISYRTYRRAMSPLEALRCLHHDRDSRYCPERLDAFVRFMGVYPVGSFVRLDDGRYAVVTDVGASVARPAVKVVYDRKFRSMRPEVLDLADEAVGRRVAQCCNPRDFKVDIELFLP